MCHKHGLKHRDLKPKPEKFLFENKKETVPLKAIDFGLSMFFKSDHPWLQNAKKAPNVSLGATVRSRLKHFSVMNKASSRKAVSSSTFDDGGSWWHTDGGFKHMDINNGKTNIDELRVGLHKLGHQILDGDLHIMMEADVHTHLGLVSGLKYVETEQGVAQAIIRSVVDFKRDPWPLVSDNAKDLVKKTLNTDPKRRLTAPEVLHHPWLQSAKKAPNVSLGETARSRLKRFSLMNKLKKCAQGI
ncbi:hypothetical protein D8674_008847 [Pyrus ussuriensis x Pyrus communis]|uniref:Protein kinase domain-containing protein n=1 Tax=Pyrus ussuriensis x Pyrus communis TaxID=2448454 RepID=A0A5N5HUV8_9ROSA|nr:hypothetical protein D8674_008847 [Pyrus ussuriensis x Pyrus communis]